MAADGTLRVINRYPVKSLQGETVTETNLTGSGIAGDRRLALREVTTGNILSAKHPDFGAALLAGGATTHPTEPGVVTLTFSGGSATSTERDEVSALASAHLDTRVDLVGTTDLSDPTYTSYWPEIDGVAFSDETIDFPTSLAADGTSFVDLAPLHVVASSSLDLLARLSPDSRIDVARFRPSLLIETPDHGDEFVETAWQGRRARLGDAELACTVATPRCAMTTRAQGDLPRDLGVLKTLAAHNRIDIEEMGTFACLGVYAEVVRPGRVALGDELTFG